MSKAIRHKLETEREQHALELVEKDARISELCQALHCIDSIVTNAIKVVTDSTDPSWEAGLSSEGKTLLEALRNCQALC